MVIAVTGGGSGGHITPILAVAHELKRKHPKVRIVYIGQKGDSLGDLPAQDPNIDEVRFVRAGKFRRYHGESFWQHLKDVATIAKNIRDAAFVLIGLWQSFWLLRKLRPDVLFVKGGFVGVPVGLAAALLKIPFVTHDSDALPGLANRVIARWATVHAVALPKEVYSYPSDATVTVGVPISHRFVKLSADQVQELRQKLGLGQFKKIILVTGGGNGSQSLNHSIAICAPALLARYSDLAIVLLAGRGKDAAVRQTLKRTLEAKDLSRVVVKDFVTNLHEYSGAADIVVARAGGNSVAELAAQAKACVIVPNPLLTGGHQLKNAQVLADKKAVRLVPEDTIASDPITLMAPLADLLDHPVRAERLGRNLASIARLDAAPKLAVILLKVAAKDKILHSK